MRAAVLTGFGAPLSVRSVPEPRPDGGEVVVEVLATCVLPYTGEVFGGRRNYPLEPPVVPGPGGVGRVVRVGPDATRLRVGDLVWCDPTVRSRDDALTPDIMLQGLSSRGEGGARLARHLPDGAFAEFMRVPTENVHPLPPEALDDPARWSSLVVYAIPYGGLLAAGLEAGETVLVSGSTGNLGSAAVAMALAMGAGRVIAPGRNRAARGRLGGPHQRLQFAGRHRRPGDHTGGGAPLPVHGRDHREAPAPGHSVRGERVARPAQIGGGRLVGDDEAPVRPGQREGLFDDLVRLVATGAHRPASCVVFKTGRPGTGQKGNRGAVDPCREYPPTAGARAVMRAGPAAPAAGEVR